MSKITDIQPLNGVDLEDTEEKLPNNNEEKRGTPILVFPKMGTFITHKLVLARII